MSRNKQQSIIAYETHHNPETPLCKHMVEIEVHPVLQDAIRQFRPFFESPAARREFYLDAACSDLSEKPPPEFSPVPAETPLFCHPFLDVRRIHAQLTLSCECTEFEKTRITYFLQQRVFAGMDLMSSCRVVETALRAISFADAPPPSERADRGGVSAMLLDSFVFVPLICCGGLAERVPWANELAEPVRSFFFTSVMDTWIHGDWNAFLELVSHLSAVVLYLVRTGIFRVSEGRGTPAEAAGQALSLVLTQARDAFLSQASTGLHVPANIPRGPLAGSDHSCFVDWFPIRQDYNVLVIEPSLRMTSRVQVDALCRILCGNVDVWQTPCTLEDLSRAYTSMGREMRIQTIRLLHRALRFTDASCTRAAYSVVRRKGGIPSTWLEDFSVAENPKMLTAVVGISCLWAAESLQSRCNFLLEFLDDNSDRMLDFDQTFFLFSTLHSFIFGGAKDFDDATLHDDAAALASLSRQPSFSGIDASFDVSDETSSVLSGDSDPVSPHVGLLKDKPLRSPQKQNSKTRLRKPRLLDITTALAQQWPNSEISDLCCSWMAVLFGSWDQKDDVGVMSELLLAVLFTLHGQLVDVLALPAALHRAGQGMHWLSSSCRTLAFFGVDNFGQTSRPDAPAAHVGVQDRNVELAPSASWMPDKDVTHCCQCRRKFTATTRRHHCRICAKVFCGKCTSHSLKVAGDNVRVCDLCFAHNRG